MLESIKHLITCNCILQQYQEVEPTVFHQFIVFSIINQDGSIKPCYAKCNNCNAIHKVIEVNVSERLKKEDSPLVPDVEEIKQKGITKKNIVMADGAKIIIKIP